MIRRWIAIGLLFAPCVCASAQAKWQIGPWVRASEQPVIQPSDATFTDPVSGKTVHWEKLHTFNPAAVVRNGKVYVLYRAEDDSGKMGLGEHVSRVGMAESSDGVHFTKLPAPVFYPAKDDQLGRENEGGTEDPRVVEAEDGTYVMTYTQWSRIRQTYTTGVATSRDLRTWVKHGPIFGGVSGGKYDKLAYKSAGIVTRLKNGRLIAAKVNGKYLMFWGEIEVRLATSDDLIHWTPIEGKDGKPVVVLHARQGKFDSAFPEMGPPPVLTERGIVVIYNARNADAHNWNGVQRSGYGDDSWKAWAAPGIAPGTYTVGEALFDARNPQKLLARTDEPVFGPKLAWESHGQYAPGTTFAEGLVWFKGKWLMYYGASDSYVGVTSAPR
ncbi:MAG: pesticidal protein Cry15Aa [Acidobacteria bacterium]|nr:pesticidal protein Cry15Aa [Acidobacteriota bacterium]